MIVKLRKPHTVRFGEKNGAAAIVIPADRTLLVTETADGYELHLAVPCGNINVELQALLPKANAEVMVK